MKAGRNANGHKPLFSAHLCALWQFCALWRFCVCSCANLRVCFLCARLVWLLDICRARRYVLCMIA